MITGLISQLFYLYSAIHNIGLYIIKGVVDFDFTFLTLICV